VVSARTKVWRYEVVPITTLEPSVSIQLVNRQRRGLLFESQFKIRHPIEGELWEVPPSCWCFDLVVGVGFEAKALQKIQPTNKSNEAKKSWNKRWRKYSRSKNGDTCQEAREVSVEEGSDSPSDEGGALFNESRAKFSALA